MRGNSRELKNYDCRIPLGFDVKAAHAARRERRPGGGSEPCEEIAVSYKTTIVIFYATGFRAFLWASTSSAMLLKTMSNCGISPGPIVAPNPSWVCRR